MFARAAAVACARSRQSTRTWCRITEGRRDRPTDSIFTSALLASRIPLTVEVLALRYLAGLTAEEIGTATELSASGVRSRLSRLIARLREDLGHD